MMESYFADARKKPLFGWIVAGEVIGGLGLLCTVIFAVLAFTWVREQSGYVGASVIITRLFPFHLVLTSSLACLLIGIGVVWVIAAHLVRAFLLQRPEATPSS
ncbi:hypothetical protein [Microlunatus parietis]|uniref:Cell division protein FtsX n=1 Tax=Microlunatus parietis TaxID=682979 RepID=A0A7Y9LF72_9ACTN|nr:hypothetical protein [Microlunatus parietis]NYE74563.1 cell division protein FtsX [Microlunatus parietis]